MDRNDENRSVVRDVWNDIVDRGVFRWIAAIIILALSVWLRIH